MHILWHFSHGRLSCRIVGGCEDCLVAVEVVVVAVVVVVLPSKQVVPLHAYAVVAVAVAAYLVPLLPQMLDLTGHYPNLRCWM